MKIVVLAGGISTERDVSLSSGVMIYRALKKNGHKAILLDVYLGYTGDDAGVIFEKEEDWAKEMGAISESNPDIEQIKAMRSDGDKNFFGPNVIAICQAADAVFMALHGENGENGKIQACFDLMGITYTGTDYVSSALCMDKGLSKDIFACHGIPTPAGIRLKKGENPAKKVPFPCIVKACCGGSSVGVSIAAKEEEYAGALAEAFRYDDEVIVEQYIKGREFSVGVMDGKALPVIEIAPLQGFYDYKNKYQAGSTIETCPAELSEEKTKEMQGYAEAAFKALRLKNYARMDFMMGEKGDIYCLEANTLPGMTPTSLLPQEAAAEGMSFEELCEKILRAAVRR
ncbi:MAG: D-alanine--D-alanine ligase [Lachnospiraceae bacterium]|nr:D-alanine--D-alanine ligase [Lachnospiraceae bacterium]